MKKSAEKRIIIWSVVSAVLIAALVAGMLAVDAIGCLFGVGGREMSETDCAEFSAAEIKGMDVQWDAGEIYVSYSYADTENIKITEYTENRKASDNMSYTVDDDGTLVIQSNSSVYYSLFGLFGESTVKKDLYIEIPYETEMDSVSINAEDANIYVDEIDVGDFEVEINSGYVGISNVYADSLNIGTVSGEIFVDSGKYDEIYTETVSGNCYVYCGFRSMNCSSVSGSIDVGGYRMTENFNAENVSGDIYFSVPDIIEGFTATVESINGKVYCDFAHTNSSDGKYVYGDGSTQVNIESVSGDVSFGSNDSYEEDVEEGISLEIDFSSADEVCIEHNMLGESASLSSNEKQEFLDDFYELIKDSKSTYDCYYDSEAVCSVEIYDNNNGEACYLNFMKSCIEVHCDNSELWTEESIDGYYTYDGYDLKRIEALFKSYLSDSDDNSDEKAEEETEESSAAKSTESTKSTENTTSKGTETSAATEESTGKTASDN